MDRSGGALSRTLINHISQRLEMLRQKRIDPRYGALVCELRAEATSTLP